MDPWQEQWDRVHRWFDRFSQTNAGRTDGLTSEVYQDEVYAFFQNCYHLKDWLKNDPVSAGAVTDVETFISSSQNLRLCADLCNGTKHLTLTKHRESPDTKIGRRQFQVGLHDTVSVGSGGTHPPEAPTTFAAKYEVEAGGSRYDAFIIAEGCMQDWEGYLKSRGL